MEGRREDPSVTQWVFGVDGKQIKRNAAIKTMDPLEDTEMKSHETVREQLSKVRKHQSETMLMAEMHLPNEPTEPIESRVALTLIPKQCVVVSKTEPSPKSKTRAPEPSPKSKTRTTEPSPNSNTRVTVTRAVIPQERTPMAEQIPKSRTRVTATDLDDNAYFAKNVNSIEMRIPQDTYDGPKKCSRNHRRGTSCLKSLRGQELLAKYVKANICQLECDYYVRNPRSKTNNCRCGRSVDWHRMKGCNIFDKSEKDIWDPRNHTEKVPCDSFGEIRFQGFGNDAGNSPYLRLDPTTNLDKVWTILTDYWCLPYPTLVISVMGSAGRLDLKPRLKSIFQQGLINAATSTGAWIVTGGTQTGVTKCVGEAVRNYLITAGSSEQDNIVAMGITSWGSVTNKEALDGERDAGLFPARYAINGMTESRRTAALDHNHTHFLLVDDGTVKEHGQEVSFRIALQNYISGRVETGVAEKHSVNVPVVLLVVEGGQQTLKSAWDSIRNRTPIVTIQGTGKAADVIASAYRMTNNPLNEDVSAFPAGFVAAMMQCVQAEFDWSNDENLVIYREVRECVKLLMEILEHRQLVNVFHLETADAKDIDKCILYALLKANKTDPESQLALALTWNRCDIARQEIFTFENRNRWQTVNLYEATFTALVQDRVEFVQLFIDRGVDLKKLSVATMWNLYAHVINDPPNNCAELLKSYVSCFQDSSYAGLCCGDDKEETSEDLLKKVGKVLQRLLGDQSMNLYKGRNFQLSKAMASRPWGEEDVAVGQNGEAGYRWDQENRLLKKREVYEFENPERELFIWSLLLNRRKMTHLFWRLGKDHLGGAIVAASLLKAMAKVAADEEEAELADDLIDHAEYYENVAVSVISECYNNDKRSAHMLLVRELDTWGDSTLFSLAQNGGMMDFMDHACCQTKLNLIWNGLIAQHTPIWKIFLTIFCPLLVPTIKFANNETVSRDILEDHLEENDTQTLALNKVLSEDDLGVHFTQSKRREAGEQKKKKTFFRVNLSGRCGEEARMSGDINLFSAIYFFYTAPVTKFYCSMISYVVFLCLFTYFVLTNLHPLLENKSLSLAEWITWGWASTLLIEEIRQIYSSAPEVAKYKVLSWGRSFWNRFDLFMYLSLIVSIVLRCVLSGDSFVWARMVYSITLTLFYLRFMQAFYADKNVGPKVVMIKRMLTDLVFFLLILMVFVVSFGTAYHANLYPNTQLSWDILKNVLYIPYWQTYGVYNMEVIEGTMEEGSCHTNSPVYMTADGSERCPEQTWLVPVMTAIYVLLTHILLVNLLIAMFSYTFSRVQKNSEKVWSYIRFSVIFEYYDRPAVVPPLIILVHVFRLLKYCCYGDARQSSAFRRLLTRDNYNRYSSLEKSATEKFISRTIKQEQEGLDIKVTNTADRLERVMTELENIKEQIERQESPEAQARVFDANPEDSPVISYKRRNKLDLMGMNQRMDSMQEQLNTLITMLSSGINNGDDIIGK